MGRIPMTAQSSASARRTATRFARFRVGGLALAQYRCGITSAGDSCGWSRQIAALAAHALWHSCRKDGTPMSETRAACKPKLADVAAQISKYLHAFERSASANTTYKHGKMTTSKFYL